VIDRIFPRIMDMSDIDLRERLLKLAAELQNIAQELSEDPIIPVEIDRVTCPVCGEVLDDGGRIVRGVHERCYKTIARKKKVGEAEIKGILFPKEKTGRKAKFDLEKILNDADQKLDENNLKKKQKP
jgi:hypothetical protein